MIAIGSTRKPTPRTRSFIKELHRVIPHSTRLTRGKQGFNEFCETAQELGANRILLVGSFHGNPGRLGFLQQIDDVWKFQPPTLIIKSTHLLREITTASPHGLKHLYVVPASQGDVSRAEMLANALAVPCLTRDHLPDKTTKAALLRVKYAQDKSIDFMALDEQQPLGPVIHLKHFLTKPMGDKKRW
ncbi:MAG: hypothetical protein ACFFD8_02755 [Candidatus Thorarchaeota archaeon]